jgi:hypothetical protein
LKTYIIQWINLNCLIYPSKLIISIFVNPTILILFHFHICYTALWQNFRC